MAALGIDGLVSGLQTTDLINSLMSAEAAPQTLLKSKQSSTTSLVTALQALNVKVASLAESSAKAAKAVSWDATKASASAVSVTATTTTGAQPTALSFTVDAIAQGQVSLTDPLDLARFTGGASTLTLTKADGTRTEIAVGTDAAATARAISSSTAGVSAVAVTVDGKTRLQLSGTGTGLNNAFTLHAGTKAEVEAGTATALVLADTRTAQNAKITLWPGNADTKQQVSSATNTFSDVLTGTSITVSKVETDPVTLTVARDTAALTALASGLVGSLGVVLSEISSRTATTTATASDGRTTVTGGLFSGDSAVRGLQQQLSTAASYPVDGVSPSTVGITVGRDGTFAFDAEKFSAALAKDPEATQKVVAGLAQRVADVAKSTSDSVDGSLTLKVTSQQSMVTDLGKQIENWDTRLALRRESLQKTYSALEVTLSGLQSQSSWLSSQLASLSASS